MVILFTANTRYISYVGKHDHYGVISNFSLTMVKALTGESIYDKYWLNNNSTALQKVKF